MKRLLLLIIPFLLCACVDEGEILPDVLNRWTYLTEKDGLVSDLVTTMYTDSDGNVWIGTFNGLSKFDGSSFRNYTKKDGDLPDNWVLAIAEVQEAFILVGTRGGLSVFDGNKWASLPFFAGAEVTAITEDANGDIWVGTALYGLIQLTSSGVAKKQHFDYSCNDCNTINALFVDSDDVLWIGSEADLKSYDGTFKSYTVSDGLAGSWVTAFGDDQWGNMWIGSFADIAITRYDDSNFDQLPLVQATGFNWVRAIVEDRTGMIWIAADGGGLIYFDGAVMRQNFDAFEDEDITALTLDQRGELWVGSEGAGIARYIPDPN